MSTPINERGFSETEAFFTWISERCSSGLEISPDTFSKIGGLSDRIDQEIPNTRQNAKIKAILVEITKATNSSKPSSHKAHIIKKTADRRIRLEDSSCFQGSQLLQDIFLVIESRKKLTRNDFATIHQETKKEAINPETPAEISRIFHKIMKATESKSDNYTLLINRVKRALETYRQSIKRADDP